MEVKKGGFNDSKPLSKLQREVGDLDCGQIDEGIQVTGRIVDAGVRSAVIAEDFCVWLSEVV